MGLKKLLSLISSNGGVVLCGLISSIITARYLGPEGRGTIADYFLWISITLGIFGFSVTENIITFYKNEKGLNFIRLIHATRWHLIVIATSNSIISMYLLFVKNYSVLLIFSSTLVIYIGFLISICTGILLKDGKLYVLSLVQLTTPTVYVFILLLGIKFDCLDIDYVLYSNLVANIVCLLIAYCNSFATKNVSKDIKIKNEKFLIYSLRVHLSNILSVINSQVDKFIISMFLGSTALGYYAVALTIGFTACQAVTNATASFITPIVSGKALKGNKSANLYLIMNTAIILIIAFILYFLVEFIIVNLFGKEFYSSIAIAKVLLIYSALTLMKLSLLKLVRVSKDRNVLLLYIPDIVSIISIIMMTLILKHFSALDLLKMSYLFTVGSLVSLITCIFLFARCQYED